MRTPSERIGFFRSLRSHPCPRLCKECRAFHGYFAVGLFRRNSVVNLRQASLNRSHCLIA
jgi:hypothetical protein